MIGIPLALAYTNAAEWFLHKHMLHGRGKDKKSFWAFHWHEHHRESRKHDMWDPQYVRSVFTWSPQGKEALALIAGAMIQAPFFWVAPFFTVTVYWRAWQYYKMHKRAHLDRDWAKENLPWHYDHHMGKDQNANWCVTHPWFDYVMGTRKQYSYDANGKPTGEVVEPRPKGFYARYVKTMFVEPKTERLPQMPEVARSAAA
jgi:hypothetical protein